MINPTDKDIGRGVIYAKGQDFEERGTITSFNDLFVFVRYEFATHPSANGKATRREDLTWEHELDAA